MPDGAILDGRNRALACRIAGVELRTVVYDGDDPIGFVISKNERRRQLSARRRALIAARLETLAHGSNQHRKKVENYRGVSIVTRLEAAKHLGVGKSTVEKANALLRDGAQHVVETRSTRC
jgi:hypothetical protein